MTLPALLSVELVHSSAVITFLWLGSADDMVLEGLRIAKTGLFSEPTMNLHTRLQMAPFLCSFLSLLHFILIQPE